MKIVKKVSKFNYLMQCSCGEYLIAKPHELERLTDCGCGMKFTEHPLYNTWRAMKSRCYNKNHNKYSRYGERGITVCDEWLESFENFAHWGMDNGWVKGLQIDRMDNDKGYEPANCRFVSHKENQRNKENTKYITFMGKKYSRGELAELSGISRFRLRHLQERRGEELEDIILKSMEQFQVSITPTSEEGTSASYQKKRKS